MSFIAQGKINDYVAVAGVIHPQAISNGATGVLTAAIDMSKFDKLIAIIDAGTLGSSGTFDAHFEGATTSGGSYTTITGKAITQLVKATDDNKLTTIELSQEAVRDAGWLFVKLNLLCGTANSTSSAIVLGVPSRGAVASALNVTIAEAK